MYQRSGLRVRRLVGYQSFSFSQDIWAVEVRATGGPALIDNFRPGFSE
jgi:hypothetical protein